MPNGIASVFSVSLMLQKLHHTSDRKILFSGKKDEIIEVVEKIFNSLNYVPANKIKVVIIIKGFFINYS